jgi:hypothetical protein
VSHEITYDRLVGLMMLGANVDVPSMEGAWLYEDDGLLSVLILVDGQTSSGREGKRLASSRASLK